MSHKPGVIQRAKIALAVFRGGYPRAIQKKAAFPLMWPEFRLGQAHWRMVDIQSYIEEGFDVNTLIYSCIMYKARSWMSVPLRAYTGDPDHPELLPPSHPLAKLAARPNQSMSWREFQGLQDVYFNIAGESYCWLIRPRAGGIPEEMYPLNPLRVYIVPRPGWRSERKSGAILGFLYVPEGKSASDGVPILPQDMIHVKLPNPSDPLDGWGYGFSPLSPAARSGDVDNMVTKFLHILFERGAIPAGLLKFDIPLDDEIVSGIKERWKEMYGGYEAMASEIGVLDHHGSYERLGMNFDELGFEAIDERNESRICGPFGVPPMLVNARIGLKHSTYSNWEEARKAFWEDTMLAEIGLFEVEYQYYLQGDDGSFVAFDLSKVPALRKDTPALVTAWAQLVNLGVPKDLATEAVGLDLPKLPDGSVVYMPFSLVPVGSSAVETPDTNVGAAEAEDDTKALTPGQHKGGFTPEQKAAHWKAVDQVARSWEGKFEAGARECLDADRKEILALLSGAKSKALDTKATVDWKAFEKSVKDYLEEAGTENWQEVFSPMMRGVITDQGKRWSSALGIAFDVENLFAREWFNQYTLKFAQPINKTTLDTIAEMCAQAIEEGWSIPTMQDHLETTFKQFMDGDATPEEFEWYADRMPAYRREAIARTETMRASNSGTQELFKEWNVKKKEWLATRDDRVRDAHLAADGQVVATDEPFIVGGEELMYPLDPSGSPENTIECRCTDLPVIED